MVVAALIATVVIAAASAYKVNQNQQAAARQQKRANSISQAEQDAQRQQALRQQIRDDRVRRAQIIQSSENTGVDASSGQAGAIGSIGSQTAANIGTIGRGDVTANAVGAAQQSAADAVGRANTWAAIGSVASSASSALARTPQGSAAVNSGFNSLFGSPNTGVNAPPKG